MSTENLVQFAETMIAASKARIAKLDANWEARKKAKRYCNITARSSVSGQLQFKTKNKNVFPPNFVPTLANLVRNS